MTVHSKKNELENIVLTLLSSKTFQIKHYKPQESKSLNVRYDPKENSQTNEYNSETI